MIDVWWVDIVVPVLFILAIYGFLLIVGANMRWLTLRSHKTADDVYDRYADSPRQQRKYARAHGGEWKDDTSSEQVDSEH
ncbi:MAG TPA: hypothetical protein VGH27_14810 [Streptosporangiaceae bacterium]